ncbi:hypothetical protein [Arcticibacter eurypsychrophilus]|uniref:hypothetical protein n=1 Tax=Arcticibacter eurypsychrophilus TaxID=1434752 RepID=UPI00084D8434|nr:hypothetical protein [Arcticibacter eurypsychrophilus]
MYLYIAANLDISDRLNEQQVLMLRLLKNPLTEKDFLEIRKLAVKLISKILDEVVEDWELNKDIKPENYDNLSKGHFHFKH